MGIDKVLPMRLRASLIAQLVKNPPAMQEKRGRIPTLVFLCFPCGLAGKESACNAGDLSDFHFTTSNETQSFLLIPSLCSFSILRVYLG